MDGLVLGSGGWIPTTSRETCSALLREGSQALLLDAGTGLQRLVEQPELLEGVERLDLVLTHFHLDHVVGLAYLPALTVPPVVWGPGELLAGTTTRALLDRLLGPPFFSAPLERIAADVRELDGRPLELDSFELTMRVQRRHTEPTLAFRVGDALALCTDTAPDPGTVEFAGGCSVLLHEAWHPAAASDDPFHTASGAAGALAREAGVERLVLVHVSPLLRSDEELLAPAAAEFPRTEVGVDLAALPLRERRWPAR
jgi:ribonuclease BN (tRNA processing enzyme)